MRRLLSQCLVSLSLSLWGDAFLDSDCLTSFLSKVNGIYVTVVPRTVSDGSQLWREVQLNWTERIIGALPSFVHLDKEYFSCYFFSYLDGMDSESF